MSFLLATDVENYVAYASIEPITAGQYKRSVRCYSDFLGRSALRDDLYEPAVNRWLTSLADRLKPFTIHGRKRGLTPVWNWLASQGLAPWYNGRALKKTKLVYGPVQPWTVTQVRQLLDGAADIQGKLVCGVRGRDLMRAYVLVAYETGLRPSDLYRIRWNQFDANRIALIQHKTKFPHGVALSPIAMSALEPLRQSKCERVFVLAKGGIRRWEMLLFEAASRHGFTRQSRQACGTLRKTHGTEICRAKDLASAALSLGHVDGIRVARQSYVAQEAIRPSSPVPALVDALQNPAPSDRDLRRLA